MTGSPAAALPALACFLLLGACTEDAAAPARQPEGERAVFAFTDVSGAYGLAYRGPSYTAAVADVDRDGRPEIAFSRHRDLVLLKFDGGRLAGETLYEGDIHGLSFMDWNHDGWPDLYVSRGAERGRDPHAENVLLLNEQGLLTPTALDGPGRNLRARGRSATPWDLDRDGRQELFVLNYHSPQRLVDGSDRGLDRATEAGWRDVRAETWIGVPLGSDDRISWLAAGTGGGHLFRFDPDGVLQDVTAQVGIHMPRGAAVSTVLPLDADNDGDLDLYYVLAGRVNQGVRAIGPRLFFKFTSERELAAGLRFEASGAIGVTLMAEGHRRHDWGRFGNGRTMKRYPLELDVDDRRLAPGEAGPDLDRPGLTLWRDADGRLRLDFRADRSQLQAATGWIEADADTLRLVDSYGLSDAPAGHANRLFINDNGRFLDRTRASGAGGGGAGQDGVAGDFDNDGDLDLYVVNGRDIFGNPPNVLYENLGQGRFRPLEAPGALSGSGEGRGASVQELDFDGDGDLDLFISNGNGPAPGNEGPAQLLRNDSPGGNWLRVDLETRQSEPMALGTRLVLESEGRRQLRVVTAATGRAAVSWQPVHFGLGAAEHGQLTVYWPNGARSELQVSANQRLRLVEPTP